MVEYQDYCEQKFDDYISKNKLTYKKALIYLKDNQYRYLVPITDKKLQVMTISKLKQEKAKRLLFKIIEEKIEHWWD